ncbi:hypothetical protein MMC30_002735 [Trapelia coarctata]|nr:hypothetical protein [Trapelia coarctata]
MNVGDASDATDGTDKEAIPLAAKVYGFHSYLSGWRFGMISSACSVVIVLLANISLAIWIRTRSDITDGQGVFSEGTCSDVRSLSTYMHLVINVLSTILLSCSNYCMQCLSAPTRKDIDRAHARGKWLDIGVPSFRNLRNISRKRASIWCYNSVVFTSISSNQYYLAAVNDAFNRTGPLNISFGPDLVNTPNILASLQHAAESHQFEKLDNAACIQAYASVFQFSRSNVLVTMDENSTATANYSGLYYATYRVFEQVDIGNVWCNGGVASSGWVCPGNQCTNSCVNNYRELLPNASSWAPLEASRPVSYCLSQKTPEHCKLHFSFDLITVVIVFNILKALLMCYAVFGISEDPLLTLGDGISSFLRTPDTSTRGCCLFTKKDFNHTGLVWAPIARQWHFTKTWWFRSGSYTRWVACNILCLAAVSTCTGLLVYGVNQLQGARDLVSLWNLGFGSVNPLTTISWGIPTVGAGALASNLLFANIGQPLLSFIYFSFNGLFTCMLAGSEWSRFALQRKGHRISGVPSGPQRSTYFLQLPYRFAVPLMVTSGLLHWLVSQSIFLVAVEELAPEIDGKAFAGLNQNGQPLSGYTRTGYGDLTCGYSPIAIMFVILVGFLLMVTTILLGFRRYKAGIPLAANCSAVISAVCHTKDGFGDSKAPYLPLQWGVTHFEGEIGHCAFSAEKVTFPEEDHLYAGF